MIILISAGEGSTEEIIVANDLDELINTIVNGYSRRILEARFIEDQELYENEEKALLEMIRNDTYAEGRRVLENIEPINQEWTIVFTSGSFFSWDF